MKTLHDLMAPQIDTQAALPAQPEAGRLARASVEGWLVNLLDPAIAADVRLASSELVTNAIRHGGLAPDASVQLRLTVHDHTVRIETVQPTPAPNVRVVAAEERGPEGGFGMALVATIADRWGSDVGPPGRVWFELDRV